MSIVLRLSRAALATCMLAAFVAQADDRAVLKEVVVSSARLREQAPIDVPASVTVLDERTLSDSARQHFEEVLQQVPNLNWAAGSSRPRYFQIRGIGEREQYEGAPNSSVGFLIDDIDFSGIGMAATLFDVEQIEVLRGPQGTRLGANALAGLIAVRSAQPGDQFDARIAADVGNYDTGSLGVSATGPVAAIDSNWRLSLQKYRTDGFRTNPYLHRDDTNGRDELTARAKWQWHASERNRLDITFLHTDLDNGYDAFSIDNSRITLSDHPGKDSQRASAAAIKWTSDFDGGASLTAIATALDSSSVNSFDADWGNPESWAPYSDYDYVYEADRDHDTRTAEVRYASHALDENTHFAWLVGAYALRLREQMVENTNYSDPLSSDYSARNAALFGQVEGSFARRWTWSVGLREEDRSATYEDTRPSDDHRDDTMWGGNASLAVEVAEQARLYGQIARGYKAGGFNLGSASAARPEFEPEYLWNYELGFKADLLDKSLHFETTAFYMEREDMQIRTGVQADPSNPGTYVFVTTNVAHGENYGAEAALAWSATSELEVGGSLGLLRTTMRGAIDSEGMPVAPRDQPHAPNYQVQINATYRQRGFMARVDYAAVDAFYFDLATDHNQKSNPYELLNLKLGYESRQWRTYAWARNLLDEQYATRGFYFVNDPAPTATQKLYIQNGDPRTYGLSFEWSLR